MIKQECPYCGLNRERYYLEYTLIFSCKLCNTMCSVRPGETSNNNKGIPVPLWWARHDFHTSFDPIWKKRVNKDMSYRRARKDAYIRLSEAMGAEEYRCHGSRMTLIECHQAVSIIKSTGLGYTKFELVPVK